MKKRILYFTLATLAFCSVALAQAKNGGGAGGQKTEAAARHVDAVAPTSRAARRESMRLRDIPTSQQPVKQTYHKDRDGVVRRSYNYTRPGEDGKMKTMTVKNDPKSDLHGPHWEAGDAKKPNVEPNKPNLDPYKRARLENGKSRVGYPAEPAQKLARENVNSNARQSLEKTARENRALAERRALEQRKRGK